MEKKIVLDKVMAANNEAIKKIEKELVNSIKKENKILVHDAEKKQNEQMQEVMKSKKKEGIDIIIEAFVDLKPNAGISIRKEYARSIWKSELVKVMTAWIDIPKLVNEWKQLKTVKEDLNVISSMQLV